MKTAKSKKRIVVKVIKYAVSALFLWMILHSVAGVLRTKAIAQLSEITQAHINAGQVSFGINGSVVIRDLLVLPNENSKPEETILKADRIYVRFGLTSLLAFNPKVAKLTVKDFLLNIHEDTDSGKLNIDSLRVKLKKGNVFLPNIHLKRGVFQCSRYSKGNNQVFLRVPLSAELNPEKSKQKGCSFFVMTSTDDNIVNSLLQGAWQNGKFSMSGGLFSLDLMTLQRGWSVSGLKCELNYKPNGDYSFLFGSEALRFNKLAKSSHSIIDKMVLPKRKGVYGALLYFFDRFQPNGTAHIGLTAEGNLEQLNKSKISGVVDCLDVSIKDARFPYQIDDIKGKVHFSHEQVVLDQLTARHGDAKININGVLEDFGEKINSNIQFTSNKISLDDNLYNALKDTYKKIWDDFSPNGTAAVNYTSIKKDGQKNYALAVGLDNVNAKWKSFPYPLTNMTGYLYFDPHGVSIVDVISRKNNCSITINGKVDKSPDCNKKWELQIGAGNLPLDEKLVNALPGKADRFHEILSGIGVDSLDRVKGTLWYANGEDEPFYDISIIRNEIDLGKKLFDAIEKKYPFIVKEITAEGKIGLEVLMQKPDVNPVDCTIKVNCLGNRIYSDSIPYRLREVKGEIAFHDDKIEFTDLSGFLADNIQIGDESSSFELDGTVSLDRGDISMADIKFAARDVIFDQRLSEVLPQKLQKSLQQLSPTGRFDCEFKTLRLSEDSKGRKRTDFLITAEMKDCGFGSQKQLSDLNAVFDFSGTYIDGQGLIDPQFNFIGGDMRILGKPFKSIKAETFHDIDSRKWLAKNVTAELYNGKVNANAEFTFPLDGGLGYQFEAGFENVDLKDFTGKNTEPNDFDSEYTGNMYGSLSLAGQISDNSKRLGRLTVHIKDMRVGTTSPLTKLLTALRLDEPKEFVFDQMYVDSYINGSDVLFEKFDLSGDGVAFAGKGALDIDTGQVDLLLNARGNRDINAEPSVLGSLGEDFGHAVFRMEIKGDLFDPVITTKKIPLIKDTFGLFESATDN